MFAVDFSNPLLWRRLQATGPAGCPASEPGGAGNVRCADYRANGVVGVDGGGEGASEQAQVLATARGVGLRGPHPNPQTARRAPSA